VAPEELHLISDDRLELRAITDVEMPDAGVAADEARTRDPQRGKSSLLQRFPLIAAKASRSVRNG
jgi:hypothetical protein